MIVQGVDSLIRKINELKKVQENVAPLDVVTGYAGTSYGVYVHENLAASHKPGKQAKFLEQPARELSNSGELANILSTAMARGGTLQQGLLLAGLRIQRGSQKIVPVDTGNLRASAFTALESQVEAASEEAKARGLAARAKTEGRRAKK